MSGDRLEPHCYWKTVPVLGYERAALRALRAVRHWQMASVGGVAPSVRECQGNDEKGDLSYARIYMMDDYNYFSVDMIVIERDLEMKT